MDRRAPNNEVFRLQCALDHPANGADVVTSAERVIDHFVRDEGDGSFLRFISLRVVAREGHTRDSVAGTDYLECSGGVPLFSERLVRRVGAALQTDATFHPCAVECDGAEFGFFAARTLHTRALVDLERSTFHTLTDGSRILEQAAYRHDLTADFLLARDRTDPSRLLASTTMRDLAASHDLKLRFLQPV